MITIWSRKPDNLQHMFMQETWVNWVGNLHHLKNLLAIFLAISSEWISFKVIISSLSPRTLSRVFISYPLEVIPPKMMKRLPVFKNPAHFNLHPKFSYNYPETTFVIEMKLLKPASLLYNVFMLKVRFLSQQKQHVSSTSLLRDPYKAHRSLPCFVFSYSWRGYIWWRHFASYLACIWSAVYK